MMCEFKKKDEKKTPQNKRNNNNKNFATLTIRNAAA